jgi:hypothetical protein
MVIRPPIATLAFLEKWYFQKRVLRRPPIDIKLTDLKIFLLQMLMSYVNENFGKASSIYIVLA